MAKVIIEIEDADAPEPGLSAYTLSMRDDAPPDHAPTQAMLLGRALIRALLDHEHADGSTVFDRRTGVH